jgi:hypothetical protein
MLLPLSGSENSWGTAAIRVNGNGIVRVAAVAFAAATP